MKKTLSIILAMILCLGMFAGCDSETTDANSSATHNSILPLPETIDINNIDSCTVAATLAEGGAFVDDSGKMQMTVKVFTYELYDMVDVTELKEGDEIVRLNESIKVTSVERLDSGLVRINGGEEVGGFDLITDDSTVYYEICMGNMKNYYELCEVTLPVSEDFIYSDAADAEVGVKEFYSGDFLVADSGVEYNFVPNTTSIVVENGEIIKMDRVYMS